MLAFKSDATSPWYGSRNCVSCSSLLKMNRTKQNEASNFPTTVKIRMLMWQDLGFSLRAKQTQLQAAGTCPGCLSEIQHGKPKGNRGIMLVDMLLLLLLPFCIHLRMGVVSLSHRIATPELPTRSATVQRESYRMAWASRKGEMIKKDHCFSG